MTKQIPLTRGRFALVDDDDYERVACHKWSAFKPRHVWYAVRGIRIGLWNYKKQLLHRFIMNAPDGIQIDHINGDGLNCTKDNLRFATNVQNNWNKGKTERNTSGYKGVDFMKRQGKWRARINVNMKSIHIGLFDTAEEAAKAYNEAAYKYHGEFSNVNDLPNQE